MTPEQNKLVYELITNPSPGSKVAEAKAWGVDLTLLYANLQRTPTERARKFASLARSIKTYRKIAENDRTVDAG